LVGGGGEEKKGKEERSFREAMDPEYTHNTVVSGHGVLPVNGE
jgi:hypothetical protein